MLQFDVSSFALLSCLQEPMYCIIQYRKAVDKYDGTVRCSCIVETKIYRGCLALDPFSFVTFCSLLFCHNFTSCNFFGDE